MTSFLFVFICVSNYFVQNRSEARRPAPACRITHGEAKSSIERQGRALRTSDPGPSGNQKPPGHHRPHRHGRENAGHDSRQNPPPHRAPRLLPARRHRVGEGAVRRLASERPEGGEQSKTNQTDPGRDHDVPARRPDAGKLLNKRRK